MSLPIARWHGGSRTSSSRPGGCPPHVESLLDKGYVQRDGPSQFGRELEYLPLRLTDKGEVVARLLGLVEESSANTPSQRKSVQDSD